MDFNTKQNKVCSFFGHRKINVTEELKQHLTYIIKDLIVNHNVTTFLFGSRSDFNDLCRCVVTELKSDYTFIKRVVYTCQCESYTLQSDKTIQWKTTETGELKQIFYQYAVEEHIEHKTKYTAGRGHYVERNQAMIDDSDYCVFYYDINYKPAPRKYSKRNLTYYQPKSGTALAYAYAKQKKKKLINLFK